MDDRAEREAILNALSAPPWWVMLSGVLLVLFAISQGSVWAGPIGMVVGGMAGERDAFRRVSALLRSDKEAG